MITLDLVLKTVAAVGSLGTLIGVWFAYLALRANHDWNRRHYAVEIIRCWNDITADHAKAIEETFPHIRDIDLSTGKTTEITKEKAREIYTCNPDNKNWAIRFHIIELLNHFEFVITAYSHQVADRGVILVGLRDPLSKWHDILKNFLEIVEQCEGYQPWQSFMDQIADWNAPKRQQRKKTA